MGYNILIANETNTYYFQLFKAGDECGLRYLYDNMNKPLHYYGRKLDNDTFLIGSIIQDAFLRAWNFRDKVTSLFHLFFFIRLVMRWERARYYASKSGKHRSRIYFVEYNEDIAYSNFLNSTWHDRGEKELSAILSDRAVQIDVAIKHLPDYDRKVMTLFYHQGLSEKQIARKFNNSHQSVSNIIRKNTDTLKAFLLKKPLQTKLKPDDTFNPLPNLSAIQTRIYHMRKMDRFGFDRISTELNMPIEDVILIYAEINELSNQMRKHASKRYSHYKKNTITN